MLRQSRDPQPAQIAIDVRAEPCRRRALVDHAARSFPHPFSGTRTQELRAEEDGFGGERVRVTALGDQERVAFEEAAKGREHLRIEREHAEGDRQVVRELRIGRMRLPAGEPAPSFGDLRGGRPAGRKRTADEQGFDLTARPDRHEEVGEACVLGLNDSSRASCFCARAIVVGVPFGTEAVGVLEGHHHVGWRVNGVPARCIAERGAYSEHLERLGQLLREERVRSRQASALFAAIATREEVLFRDHRCRSILTNNVRYTPRLSDLL